MDEGLWHSENSDTLVMLCDIGGEGASNDSEVIENIVFQGFRTLYIFGNL